MIRSIALLLVASSLAACDRPHYHSTFPKVPAECCLLDRFPDGPKHLAKGQANEGEIADAYPNSGILSLQAPATIEDDPITQETRSPSVGLFRTGLNYGPGGAAFSLRATFQKPDGPFDGKAWSVGVGARDGGLDDRYNAKRVSVTLRFKAGGAMLNIGTGADPSTKPPPKDIGAELYRSIRNRDQPQPFTLELYVDRSSGKGAASLFINGDVKIKQPFNLDDSLRDTVFTTAGATLTDCCVPNAKLTAELTDFQIREGKAP